MPSSNPSGRLAVLAQALAAFWLLAGAGFKLLQGTPNDLPPSVRDFPLELGLTYKLAIGIELSVAYLALAQPRWGWVPIVLVFLAFDAILAGMLGEASCGCFGSTITIPPVVMLAIDSLLLVLVLVTRPWRLEPRRFGAIPLAIGFAVLAALPWFFDRQLDPGTVEVVENGTSRPVENAWVELRVEDWQGKTLYETPLAKFVDLDPLIHDGLWVLYRLQCDHCAAHLAHLAETEIGERMVTLVRLKETSDTEANRVVGLMPEGGFVQNAQLPDSLTWVVTTPAEFVVQDGKIARGEQGVGVH